MDIIVQLQWKHILKESKVLNCLLCLHHYVSSSEASWKKRVIFLGRRVWISPFQKDLLEAIMNGIQKNNNANRINKPICFFFSDIKWARYVKFDNLYVSIFSISCVGKNIKCLHWTLILRILFIISPSQKHHTRLNKTTHVVYMAIGIIITYTS